MIRQTIFYLACLFVLLTGSQAYGQIAFVKTIGTTSTTTTGTTTTLTVPASGVAAGNSVILFLSINPSAGTISCSDSKGNSYTSNRNATNGSGTTGVRTVVLSAHNIIALTSGNTITCTHRSVTARALSASEFSGLATTATVDKVASATGNNTTPSSGATATTAQASELLIGGIGVEGPTTETFTAGANYTAVGRAGTSGGTAANNITINPEYRIVSATGAYSANGTLSATRRWAAAIVTYKAAPPPLPTKLVVVSVNGGSSPTAGMGFPVLVQSQTVAGTPANVVSATGVSLSLKTGTGTLGGTLSGTIAAGTNQVTITGVTYTKAETGVVITATRTSGDTLTAGDSTAFTVNPGTATKLAFSIQLGNSTAGGSIAGPPTVVVQDSLGNTVTSSTASITVAIGTNPGGGTLSGTTAKNASGGVASFSDLSIDKSGAGYTLTASATGLTGPTSSAFNITAAAASKLVFTTQPTSATAGSVIGAPPTVTIQDNFGNTVTSSTASITIAIGTNPGGGTLSGTTTKSALSGVATFTDLSINKATTGYTLTASSTGLTGATSSAFNINAGAAAALVFSTQPGNAAAGSAISGPPTITVQDSFGNPVTSSTASITVAIGTNPGGGTLSGTLSKNAAAGVASFTDLSIDKTGAGYTLTAAATGLTGATSASLNISAGAAAKLAFTTQPGNAAAGTNIPGPPTVTVQDNFGNTILSSTISITVAIGTNPGGGTLSGTTTKNTVSGAASFTDLGIDKAANGYTLTASATGLTGAATATFNISSGAAAQVVFTTQPGNATAGNAIPGPTTVTVQDSFGNTVTSSTASITVAIGNNPGGGTLSGTTTKNAITGVASFSDISLNKSGTGYTLTASAASLTGATSNAFSVSSGADANLVLLSVNGGSNPSAGNGFPVVVQSQDANGNPANVNVVTAVTLSLKTGTGTLGGTLTGTIVAGGNQVTINGATYSKAEGGVVLTATATSGDTLAAGDSAPFAVDPGAAAALAFTTQPGSVTAGSIVTGPPTVAVKDSFGNTVTSSTASIIISVGNNPGGSTLSGTTSKNASSGTASFSDLSLDKAGTAYTLTASATGLTSATSSAFDISAGAAAKLAFVTQPGNSSAGNILTGPPTVVVQDSLGNTITSATASITVAIGSNPAGGVLSGTTTVNASAGSASFNDLSIDKIGTGYTLTAASTGLTGATSGAFNIGAGTATKLAFTTQPGSAVVGSSISGPPTVTVQDALGNTATSSNSSVTIAIGTNPSGGTLSGTTTVSATSGVATFSGLTINQAGNGYTLTVSSVGLTGATSNGFNITSGSGGGTISGVITRVTDGTAVSGAIVEAFQGTVLKGATSTNASGGYAITGLADGTYTARASSSGFVPRLRDGVTIVNSAPVTLNLSLNVGIAIHSPIAGTVINNYSALVTGEFDTSLAPEVGINVNGIPAKLDMETFSAIVAVGPQTTNLTATVTNMAGTSLASETIPVTAQASAPPLTLHPRPTEGIAPLTVSFDLTSLVPISQISLDANGDGTVDLQGSTLAGQTFIFQQPGLYYPTVHVTANNGVTYSAVSLIQVYDATSFDDLFQQKWQGFKTALRTGNTAAALLYIAQDERAEFQGVFQNLTVPLSSIDQVLTDIQFVQSRGDTVEYEMLRTDGRGQLSYIVRFVLERDGVWRIQDL